MPTLTTPLSDTDLGAIQSAKVVDARGSACPGPLLEAKKAMNTVQLGQTIEIWSSDPGTKSDIGAWSTKVGHTFLGVLPGQGYERVFVVRQK
ncbi:MAG: sulfurtransferase TusA family protein [Chloroflexota bacterium]